MTDDKRPELGTVIMGQTVIVVTGGSPQMTARATVAKVGRVWIDVVPEDGFHLAYYDLRFRMSDQRTANRTGTGTYFYTEDQYAWRQRLSAAQSYLRGAGITVEQHARADLRSPSVPGPWYRREVELANVLRAHERLDPL